MFVSPSILSADFSKLLEEVKDVYNCGATFLHVDVMDGHFVPNITIGPTVLNSIKGKTPMILDVHLMIENPDKYIKSFYQSGANIITFHYETTNDPLKIISLIKGMNVKAGISIKPDTDVKVLKPFLQYLDLVLVMSVEPGFGGQKFMDNSLEKISYLKKEKELHNYQYLIEVDGGINLETAKLCADCGCDIVVSGTTIFKAVNRQEVIKGLLAL